MLRAAISFDGSSADVRGPEVGANPTPSTAPPQLRSPRVAGVGQGGPKAQARGDRGCQGACKVHHPPAVIALAVAKVGFIRVRNDAPSCGEGLSYSQFVIVMIT